jgi:hypothetical protein
MSELARLRFKSMAEPKEHGALLLNDDGTLEIVASPALTDEMARREETAIKRSKWLGYGIGVPLIVAGLGAVALGWLAGRIFGKLGATLSAPRPISSVDIERTEGGGVHLRFPGIPGGPQMIEMAWNADELRPDDVERFFSTLEDLNGTRTGN